MADKKNEKDVGSTARKVKTLQKQYNKILVDLFAQFAPESIEEALDSVEGSFGQNIHQIIQAALDNLHTKVCEELGVAADSGAGAGPQDGIAGIEILGIGGETEDLEDVEHEAGETEEEEAEERETGVEDEEEESESEPEEDEEGEEEEEEEESEEEKEE